MRISDWSSDVCSSDLIGSRLAPHTFTVGGSHKKANESYGAALIDDDTPTPEHAVFRWSSLRRVLREGGALWLASMALPMVAFGWQHTFTQMGWFVTNEALVTVGGDYVVLHYIYKGTVDFYGWVNP